MAGFGCTAGLLSTSTNTMLWSITVVRGGSVTTLFTNVGFVVRYTFSLFFSFFFFKINDLSQGLVLHQDGA